MTLLTIQEATKWATKHLKKEVSPSNISYLVQYGKVRKHGNGKGVLISIEDLQDYYKSYNGSREISWKKRLGDDLNWDLSFDYLREKDTTKHVHRLHPYKGKFIPQLVEYFIDDHTDKFKREVYFQKGDILLDPFLGSGTTIVQASELGIHSIGIDISQFNCTIARSKIAKYDIPALEKVIYKISSAVQSFEDNNHIQAFEVELLDKLAEFNSKYFPSPDFKYQVNLNEINEEEYASKKETTFLPTYKKLIKKYNISINQKKSESFLDKWYLENTRREIDYVFSIIKKERNPEVRQILNVILSRTIRSCRATTHNDLATLREPQLTTYYCYKHKKICKPIFSIKKMFSRYATDTLHRVNEFEKVRNPSYSLIMTGDSRTVNIFEKIKKQCPDFYKLLSRKKIKGIFSSPPYVGQIDYHEQHAYAYNLLGYKRKDDSEIGPLYKGKGIKAKESYVQGISDVLNNCKQYLDHDYDVFLVANDKFNLYPEIAEKSGMEIINRFKRPVLNRTERDRAPYSEIIFHFKQK
jgi:hypothetical protein